MKIEDFKLINDKTIPAVGFGTWKLTDPDTGTTIIRNAISAGYRHIDSASSYGNEAFLKQAIEQSGLAREAFFITGKVWNSDQGYESTLEACLRSLKNLGMDYLDLYLIHWPIPKDHAQDYQQLNYETWKAFETLYEQGLVKAIGVSNFEKHHLQALMAKPITIQPMQNQIEVHPFYFNAQTIQFCRENGIVLSSYSPLMRGKNLDHPLFSELGKKYGKSPAQIILRWDVQHGIIPLPKSTNPHRIKENLDIFDFEIEEEDMQAMNNLHRDDGKIGSYPDLARY